MKISKNLRILTLSLTLPLALSMSSDSVHAAPAPAKNPPLKGPAIKHAQDVLGKPLTENQKKAVRAAQKERLAAMKPIQEKFKAKVAKILGLSVAQYEAKEKALHNQGPKK